ncbi:MAG: tripartite tricarboxylate transporter permease [Clostridia bacterium]|nr:tripartite tricarboxylate transporter permease [Clostridia bacterium]
MIELLVNGFLGIMSIDTILFIGVGVFIGIVFGAIPGLTATMAVALFLPVTYGLSPINGMSLLMGLYLGGISGGLIPAILLNMPGTPSSITTAFDGYPMTQKGQAGKALGIGIVFSFLGGLIGILVLIFVAPPLAEFSLRFAAFEYFAIAIFSLTMIAGLSEGSLLKGLISASLGITIGMVGMAPIDSAQRFTFGISDLTSGFALLPALIGFYAVSEVFKSSESRELLDMKDDSEAGKIRNYTMKGFGFTFKEFVVQIANLFRSSMIGTGIGMLPGLGGTTANIISYGTAKSQSKNPKEFGKGSMSGLVASESSNNASIGGALIPLFTLGIPGDTVTAMLLGGLMIHGLQPGPLLFQNNGELIYSIFAALFLANIIMIIYQFSNMKVFVKLLNIPKHILFPIIITLCVVGAFALNNRVFDVYSLIIFGLMGYALMKLKFPVPPVIMGFILGPIMEQNLRRGLMMSRGSITPFLTRPISAVFLGLAVLSIIIILYRGRNKSYGNMGGNR